VREAASDGVVQSVRDAVNVLRDNVARLECQKKLLMTQV
jgi:hypothetical protein